MKKLREILFGTKKSAILTVLSLALIAIGSVGTTQAALTYFSDDYRAYANVSSIRVGLVEEGELIAGGKEEYNKDNTTSYNANGVLKFPNIDKLVLGQTYDENVSARNIGDYDQYLRVHVYKSWYVKNEDGSYTKKDTKMDPSLIELTYNTKENWILDSSASTKERETLYYKTYLKSGDTTEPFIEKIKISEKIQPKVVTKDNGDGTITTTFYYDDYKFIVKVEVEAIQTHNADKAIQATWGVDPTSKGMDVSYEQIVEDYE